MKYELILLDADRTVFDFNRAEAEAVKKVFLAYNLAYTENVLAQYCEINNRLWEDYEKGKIEKKQLLISRFNKLFEEIGITDIDTAAFNDAYLSYLGRGSYLIEGAKELCRELSKTKMIMIATNGNEKTQLARIKNSDIRPYIRYIAISETAGYPKPDKRFFEYAVNLCGFCDKEKVLIIGDSLEADIKGGIDFGIDSCWYNPNGFALPDDIKPAFVVKELKEILYI